MMDNRRNRIAWRICVWVLTHIADDTYQAYIGGAIKYGMASAAVDIRTGRDPLDLDGRIKIHHYFPDSVLGRDRPDREADRA
ncbi:hypothetical protein WKY82_09075 [Gordonia malaquae]|uniref:hypothetical protein n=1 Tax=Gordonia malaquae TaxID=410332 RepID=UPI0030C793E3